MSTDKQYRHLRLKTDTAERFKRQAAMNNRTLIAFLDYVALRWEEILLEPMTEDEKERYFDCQMTFAESERIRRRKKTDKAITDIELMENVA
jgi:hypothetical protein